jgi:hypothetical protein
MWPLTAEIPKGLLPLGGLPFVEYQIRQLAAIGVDDVVLAVGRKAVGAWEAYAATAPEGVTIRLVIEDEPLDTAGPVRAGLDTLDERFFVLNATWSSKPTSPPCLGFRSLAIRLVSRRHQRLRGVVVDGNGLVQRFVEKPPGVGPGEDCECRRLRALVRGLAGYAKLCSNEWCSPTWSPGRARGSLGGRWMDIGTPSLYLDTYELVMTGGAASIVPRPPTPCRRTGRGSGHGCRRRLHRSRRPRRGISRACRGIVAEGAVVRRAVLGPVPASAPAPSSPVTRSSGPRR